jgi:hypothetical protein
MKYLMLLLCLLISDQIYSQLLYNPNDERFKSLYLEKVQNDYKFQKEEYNRQKVLRDKNLISNKEYKESESSFKSAQITYKQAILSLVFEQPHITIERAVKFQSKDGRKRVKITLKNATGGMVDGKPIQLEDFEDIHVDRIANVYVSLLNDQHSIISQPYEAKIPFMLSNNPVSVDFLMLQDMDNITVKCVYADKIEEKKIFLQKDESANKVLITSEQFSQEADLGTRANYNLALELFSSMDNIYKLEVLNLPQQVSSDFFDSQSNARISQVKFSQDINIRKLMLAVYLPDRYDSSSLIIDKPIIFYAVAIPQAQVEAIAALPKKYTSADLENMNLSYIKLELVPRGIGRIQVRAVNFYYEIKPEEKVKMDLSVFNEGTRKLDNIKIKADLPMNWNAVIAPDLISLLLPGKEAKISLTILPEKDVNIGDYEATIKTESYASNRKVESDDKKIRIHVASNSNIFGNIFLILLLVGVLSGIVIFGVKLSKK